MSADCRNGSVPVRAIGTTGAQASVLGFGTGDNAGLMVLGSRQEQQRSVLDAIESGINYFDTSPDYGRGMAEENLGRALRGRRQDVLITTKVEIMPADRHRLASKVAESIDQSLRRLGTDYVDVLQIHNPPGRANAWNRTTWTPLVKDDFLREGGALDGLARVIAAGKARFGGIACEDADPAAVAELVSHPCVQVLNVWLNLLNPSSLIDDAEGAVDGPADYRGIAKVAAAEGVGLAGFRALGGGSLMSAVAGTLARHPIAGGGFSRSPASYEREVKLAARFAQRLGIRTPQEMVGLAYRFNITDPRVFTSVGGYSERSHLQGAIAAVSQGPLAAEEMQWIFRTWRQLFVPCAPSNQV